MRACLVSQRFRIIGRLMKRNWPPSRASLSDAGPSVATDVVSEILDAIEFRRI